MTEKNFCENLIKLDEDLMFHIHGSLPTYKENQRTLEKYKMEATKSRYNYWQSLKDISLLQKLSPVLEMTDEIKSKGLDFPEENFFNIIPADKNKFSGLADQLNDYVKTVG